MRTNTGLISEIQRAQAQITVNAPMCKLAAEGAQQLVSALERLPPRNQEQASALFAVLAGVQEFCRSNENVAWNEMESYQEKAEAFTCLMSRLDGQFKTLNLNLQIDQMDHNNAMFASTEENCRLLESKLCLLESSQAFNQETLLANQDKILDALHKMMGGPGNAHILKTLERTIQTIVNGNEEGAKRDIKTHELLKRLTTEHSRLVQKIDDGNAQIFKIMKETIQTIVNRDEESASRDNKIRKLVESLTTAHSFSAAAILAKLKTDGIFPSSHRPFPAIFFPVPLRCPLRERVIV
jgi:hypothetical protein